MSSLIRSFSLLFFVAPALCALSWNATPFNPSAMPLAVRSPYLSAWLTQGQGTALNAAWPTFWTGSILGWAGYIKVDGITYNFLGDPVVPGAQKAVQKSSENSSQPHKVYSPVEPNDLVNQSIPLSYLALEVASNDNNAHSVQVYTDISAEWISGDDTLTANWTTTVGDIITHQVQLVNQTTFGEVADHIQQGSAYYSTQGLSGTTYQSGEDIILRAQFINNSKLLNTQDSEFRAVSDRWPVFAFAVDLGNVLDTSQPVVFSVGHIRDPAIEYIVANGATQLRSSYFRTRFSSVGDAISAFLNDYGGALTRAQSFDANVAKDASKIAEDYASIVALAIRQGMASVEITTSKDSTGNFNASDALVFMKEISSDGNVNTVDVIFPAWPLFLYTNPAIGKGLLLPIFEYQATGQYPNEWCVHDLGAHYPQALGHNDGQDLNMPVEESGNMLIMTLSYTQQTNDTSLLTTYYDLLDQWTQFLIADSLTPADQPSTDDFAGSLANQTNLAIKGIIGIKAMSELAALAGDTAKSANYSTIAATYVREFQQLANSSDDKHLTLAYGNDSSWGLTYNLYADKLLNTAVFPESVFNMQTNWYNSVTNDYGLPLDTRHTYTLSGWEIWTAAFVTSSSLRDSLISLVRKYASDGQGSQPFGDWYDATTGAVINTFKARPVVGAHLALLALSPGDVLGPGTGSNSTSSASTSPVLHILPPAVYKPHQWRPDEYCRPIPGGLY
ncbi:hypothetical protein A0H81_09936 [Grifola frondosa]|uniref:Glutaminase A n=1 Tax=Grifola frondosa TaxID=5627 RepID=A0A1C7LZC5_GRIFR|nr:hypothetical protein A0H81_09936 [Grifola frondosa]